MSRKVLVDTAVQPEEESEIIAQRLPDKRHQKHYSAATSGKRRDYKDFNELRELEFRNFREFTDNRGFKDLNEPPLRYTHDSQPVVRHIQERSPGQRRKNAFKEGVPQKRNAEDRSSILDRIGDIFASPFKHRGKSEDKYSPKKQAFPCDCGPSSVTYACSTAKRWLDELGINVKERSLAYYNILRKKRKEEAEGQIKRDLYRSFPTCEFFKNGLQG